MGEITKIKIFPSIGIARLGNSLDFFTGPEIPGNHNPQPSGYRDAHCRIKRQAACFRLYGYDESALLQYSEKLEKELEAYLRTRQMYYSREQRWPESLFWERRRGDPAQPAPSPDQKR